jgi:hypothetical protein
VPRPADKGQVPQPTDVTTYSAPVGTVEDRDLAADLALMVEARDVLGGQVQLHAEGDETASLTAELDTDAEGSVALVNEANARPDLAVDGLSWRVSGRGLFLELESELTPADGLLWAAVVDGTADLGGLARERLVLSVDAEQELTACVSSSAPTIPSPRPPRGWAGPPRSCSSGGLIRPGSTRCTSR